MKPFPTIPVRQRRKNVCGVTLSEMIITVAVFLYIFTGTWICIQLFGLRTYTLAATKLMATANGRGTLNQIRDQIREAKLVYVGNCSGTTPASFCLITNGLQQGNALQIYPTTNQFWYYNVFYLDTNTTTNCLLQFTVTNTLSPAGPGNVNWVTTFTNTLARHITNNIVFDMEDWQTNIPSSEASLNNRLLIRVTMQFSQWEFPIASIGTNGLNKYDYYQLRTRVFRRAWN